MSMANCTYCNELLDENEMFCQGCGAKAIIQDNYDDLNKHKEVQPTSSTQAQVPDAPIILPLIVCDSCKQSNSIGSLYCQRCGKSIEQSNLSASTPAGKGFLILPDRSEIPVTQTQRLVGRVDLAKYVSIQEANIISRAHFTIYQELNNFYVVDGKTTIQDKPSANSTSVLTNGQRKKITQNGPYQLRNGDELIIADILKIRFEIREK